MNGYTFLKAHIDALPRRKSHQYSLDPAISEAEIGEHEKRTGVIVPDELREFYQLSYGARLSDYKVLTIPEIVERRSLIPWQSQPRRSILPFAYLIGVGDFIAFDLERTSSSGLQVLDGFVEHPAEQWLPICYGLKTWLPGMIETNFEPFWLRS
jgi:hypothetical protein